jgi:hypothetical protein
MKAPDAIRLWNRPEEMNDEWRKQFDAPDKPVPL